MGRFLGLPVGLMLGLLASYLFRPSTILGVPSFSEWFSSEAFKIDQFRSTMLICAGIGAVLGLVLGAFLDRRPATGVAT